MYSRYDIDNLASELIFCQKSAKRLWHYKTNHKIPAFCGEKKFICAANLRRKLSHAICLLVFFGNSFIDPAFQQESDKIGQGVETAIEADVFVTKLDAVSDVLVSLISNQLI